MTFNVNEKNTYKNFLTSSGALTSLSAPAAQYKAPVPAVKVGKINADNFVSGKDQNEQTTQGPNRKKLFGIIGISVGMTLLLFVISLFTISKGFSGTIAKKLTKISDKAKKAIYDLTTQSQNLTTAQKLKLTLHKGVQHLADGMQASSNITALKDSAVSHYLKKWKMTPIVDKINNFFKNKIVLKTKNIAYNEAELSSIEFCNYLEKLAKESGSPQLAQKAKQIMTEYTSKFSAQQHINRSQEAWESMKGLDEQVYNALYKKEGGFFNNLKQLRSYLTLDFISPRRTMVQKDLNAAKSQISNSLYDVHNGIKQALNELKISINPKNNKAVDLIKELNNILDEGRALNGITENKARTALFEKIKGNLDELLNIAKIDLKDKKAYDLAEKRIFKMYDLLKPESYKKGLAQEAVTQIKTLFPAGKNSKEYKQALNYLEKMNSKLNNAVTQEMNSYEKLGELAVGSAPTDIIGILWPSALATGLIVNADSKDERISKTLTQGIPILGGVGVTYYGMLRGFTGVKNLALGLGSTFLLNMIGTKTDELVKKYRIEQHKLKEAFESFTKMQKAQP